MRVTIYGPNLPRSLSDLGTLVAHKEGCADTLKALYRNLGADQGRWGLDAETVKDIITAVYPPDEFDYSPNDKGEYNSYRSDVHMFPCVDLPEE